MPLFAETASAVSNGWNVLVAILPIAVLIFLMTKRNAVPGHVALPAVAVLMLLVRWLYFQSSAALCGASVLIGLLTAWQPILIVWGAVLLFRTMENSGRMDIVRRWLNRLTDNRIAQLMIVGWAFSFLVEGVAGFGTPAALAAPLLVGMGFPPLRVAALCLIMNSVPASFAAVGVPTWFGFQELHLGEAMLRDVAWKTSILHFCASLVVPVVALRLVEPWREIRRNLVYVYISILSCSLTLLIVSGFPYKFSYEFPSMLGGFIGLILSAAAARAGIGLARGEARSREKAPPVSPGRLLAASMPIWATILLLLLTRLPQLPLGGWLQAERPEAVFSVGFGRMSVSPALVVQLTDVFGIAGKEGAWKHQILYVPSIVPFFVISALAFLLFRMDRQSIAATWLQSWHRMIRPIVALSGGLVIVKLLSCGGDDACTVMIGRSLGDLFGPNWLYGSPYLGALGTFFAGSNTISNMLFGDIQRTIALRQDLDVGTILALQSVGGAMGNMTCINKIVTVCSVLGLSRVEGNVLKHTAAPMFLYGLVVTLAAVAMTVWFL